MISELYTKYVNGTYLVLTTVLIPSLLKYFNDILDFALSKYNFIKDFVYNHGILSSYLLSFSIVKSFNYVFKFILHMMTHLILNLKKYSINLRSLITKQFYHNIDNNMKFYYGFRYYLNEAAYYVLHYMILGLQKLIKYTNHKVKN